MPSSSLTLPSGTKFRTQSNRRFVVVVEYVLGKPYIEYRTDDASRAVTRAAKVGHGAVVVDTVNRLVRVGFGASAEWVQV